MIKKPLPIPRQLPPPPHNPHLLHQHLQLPPDTSSYSWNTHLRSLTDSGRHLAALSLYRLMLLPPNPRPNSFTFPSALRSAAALSLPLTLSQLHSHALKLNSLLDPYVLTSLISSYSRLSLLPLAHRAFDDAAASSVPVDTLVVCYNSLISGYALHSSASLAFSLFKRMVCFTIPFNSVTVLALLPSLPSPYHLHALLFRTGHAGCASDVSIENCIISCYAKCGDVELARKVFDEMPESERDVISYNAMVSCYAQNGFADKVLELYHEIRRSGRVRPDPVTLVSVLSACANLGAHALGREIEREITGNPDFSSNIFLKNALINMHARCGDLARASEIFEGMREEKTLVSWTAIIVGYGAHGQGRKALELFERMLQDGIQADGVVMVSVLSACSHSGLTDKGLDYFAKMEKHFGLHRGPEHYACMVDLLGRAGRLDEAWDLIRSMPVAPDGGVWGALLGACKIHKNAELGRLAFDRLIELEPTNVGYYVLLSNIYLDAGRMDDVASIRMMMRKRGLKKDPGCSYVELKGKVHLFMADDHSHPLANSIYQMISKLEAMVKNEKGDRSEEDERGNAKVVGFHSEKLAVAFGLLSTEAGVEIVVMKNLRVCEDCHLFMRLASKIVNRKLIVRDASRFHHFEGGACSCNDYW